MFNSKIFYIASLVAALAGAYGVWDGSNVLETAAYSAIGGPVIGAFAWFMYGKIADKLK